MKLYEILNKEDKELFRVAKMVLGPREFKAVKSIAIERAIRDIQGKEEIRKANIVRRTINSVLIIELKKKGVTHWRELIR